MKIKAKYVQQVAVIDPDTQNIVEIDIYKLESGALIGIDASYLANTEDDVYSPYDKNVKIDPKSFE